MVQYIKNALLEFRLANANFVSVSYCNYGTGVVVAQPRRLTFDGRTQTEGSFFLQRSLQPPTRRKDTSSQTGLGEELYMRP